MISNLCHEIAVELVEQFVGMNTHMNPDTQYETQRAFEIYVADKIFPIILKYEKGNRP